MPKRSACSFDSAVVPPVRNQIAIDPMMEAKPRTKQILLIKAYFFEFIYLKWIIEKLRRMRFTVT